MSSKRKSRSVLTLPSTTEKRLQNSLNILEENINNDQGTPTNSSSTNTSDLEDMLDLRLKLSGLSSSSSLSWSEDYESEVAKKVESELEKLDRIFQGTENETTNYDLDEIAEWKQFFPNVYILGCNTPINSDVDSEDEQVKIQPSPGLKHAANRHLIANKKRPPELPPQDNPTRRYNSLPRKPRSLEIDQYLKISSINSSDIRKRKYPQATVNRQPSNDLPLDLSPEYFSLPFITATPIKTQMRKPNNRARPPQMLILPPIDTSFRSISATPRQASSKSMFVNFNYPKGSSKQETKTAKLKSELMKLFDHIPISNR
ncbi:unnamed protein product [Ceutorhynchus assimilis]|uniref:Uncharacterized protein n=1 Tax=Ceutorhynchus assimilis TaxID=467358 RepID=A0A9N9QQP5_9CUCU|nr:unnamed protein product [Ceutorhynchus assimilis]